MDKFIDKLARALWLVEGGRKDLWDKENKDGWRPYMYNAKIEYADKAKKLLEILANE